jgi:hypothetical protein
MDDNLESSVHIYHEISEIPEISFSRQFTLLPEETNLGNNIEGPYLVVPILPARKTSASSVTDVKIESTEAVKKSSIKSENKKHFLTKSIICILLSGFVDKPIIFICRFIFGRLGLSLFPVFQPPQHLKTISR